MRRFHRLPLLLLFVALGSVSGASGERPVLFHTPPPQVLPGEPLAVEGLLVRGGDIDQVSLSFRGPNKPFEAMPMERVYGDLFRATIPAEKVAAPGLEYFVEGVTRKGAKVPLFMSEARPARVLVVPGARVPKPKPAPPAEGTATSQPSEEPELAPLEKPAPGRGKPSEPKSEPAPKSTEPAPKSTEPAPKPPEPKVVAAPKPVEPKAEPTKPPPDEPKPREPRVEPEPKPPEPKIAAAPRTPEPKPSPPAREPPPVREPPVTRRPPAEPAPGPPAEPAPAKPATELEEELALYSAEERSAVVPRQDAKVAKAPELTTVVTRDEMIAMGARSVFDVLGLTPGLSVSRDVAGFYRTGVRSSRSDAQVLFLRDGHILNNFYDGRALANLPVENLERIEVQLGPGPAAYGLGAFDAVVNLVTRTDEPLAASVTAGTFAAFDGHVVASRPIGAIKLFGDADVLTQSGPRREVVSDSLERERIVQGYREDPLDPVGFTRDSRFLINAGVGASYESEGVGKLLFSARFMREDRSALVGLFDALGNDSRLGWQMFGVDLGFELVFGPKALGRIQFSFDDQYTSRNFQLSPGMEPSIEGRAAIPGFTTAASLDVAAPDEIFPEGLREQLDVGVRTFGLEAGGEYAFTDTHRLTFGVQAREQLLYDFSHRTNYGIAGDRSVRHNPNGVLATPADLVDQQPPGDLQNRLTLAFHAQDQWRLLPSFTATFGVRAELFQLPRAPNPGTALTAHFGPRVGVAWEVTPALVLRGSYNRATRAPTLQELTEAVPDNPYSRGRFRGNLALRPPTVDLLQLGADLAQVVGEARVRLRGNAFYQSVRDAIAAVDTTGNTVPLDNRLGVRVVGAEGEARLDVSRRTRAWLNASFFRAEDLQARAAFRLLTDTPQARLNAGLSMPLGEWLNFDFTVEIGAERRNNSRSALEALRRFRLPSYNLVTAQLRTETIADRITFALTARNLFETSLADDAYRPDRMPGGVPREGFSAFLTMRANL